MFTGTDPRAALAPRVSTAIRKVTSFGQSSHVKFPELTPAREDAGGRHWFGRGQHFVLAFSHCEPGARFERKDQPDEFFVISPDPDAPVDITIGAPTTRMDGHSVAIIPPGQSVLEMPRGGRMVRIFTHLADDLASLAANAAVYTDRHPNLTENHAWPEPADGYRLRLYSLNVPMELQKHGRIWRTRDLMFYLSPARIGPRDVARLSPHSHENFEQGTFNLEGDVVQHLRWPWTPDMRLWREDEHELCPQHSLTVMPSLVEHTTQYLSEGANMELVIFAPPRLDWSLQPGWVLNHDEYPLPPADELSQS